MDWRFYVGSWVFFSILLGIFYAVAWSVLLQIRENYLRYYQKADLQWTGRGSRFPKRRIRLLPLFLGAIGTAWILVHFVIRGF